MSHENQTASSPVTRADLVAGLARVGLRTGDLVLFHASLRSFGHVQGGAETVVDALLAAVGPEGTVVAPTFTWGPFHDRTGVVFDVAGQPCETGSIPEALRRRPQALRSEHICHSVAAIGPRAVDVLGEGVSACGPGSSFAQLYDLDAWNLFLGVSFGVCTALHAAEARAAVPYRFRRDFRHSQVVRPDGTVAGSRTVELLRKEGFRNNLAKMQPVLAEAGVLHTTRIGEAPITNVRIRDVIDLAEQRLREDIYFLLADDCRPDRGVLKR